MPVADAYGERNRDDADDDADADHYHISCVFPYDGQPRPTKLQHRVNAPSLISMLDLKFFCTGLAKNSSEPPHAVVVVRIKENTCQKYKSYVPPTELP